MRHPARCAAATLVLLALVAGCGAPSTAPPPPTSARTASSSTATPSPVPSTPTAPVVEPVPPAAGTALALLDTLEVKGRAPRTGYDRALFGQAWADVDRNGCDTRNDVLARDLLAPQIAPGTQGCLVVAGTLADPYTASTLEFVRGEDTSAAVQVDHVVALADAWQKGAQGWDGTTRTAFANDPLNLLAVDGPTNQQKGAGDAATWLPPSTDFRCAYAAWQVTVKAGYGIWVTAAERDALARVLGTCPDEPVTSAEVAAGDRAARQAAAATADQPPVTTVEVPPTAEVYYPSCADARAVGADPVLVGEPGYRPGLDGDGDGVACE